MIYEDIFFSFTNLSTFEPSLKELLTINETQKKEEHFRLLLLTAMEQYESESDGDLKAIAALLKQIFIENDFVSTLTLQDFKNEENYKNHLIEKLVLQYNLFFGIPCYIYDIMHFFYQVVIKNKLKYASIKDFMEEYQNRENVTDEEKKQIFQFYDKETYFFEFKLGRQLNIFSNIDQVTDYYNYFKSIKNILANKMGEIQIVKNQLQALKAQKESFERKLQNEKKEIDSKINLLQEQINHHIQENKSIIQEAEAQRIRDEDKNRLSLQNLQREKNINKNKTYQIESLNVRLSEALKDLKWYKDEYETVKEKFDELQKNHAKQAKDYDSLNSKVKVLEQQLLHKSKALVGTIQIINQQRNLIIRLKKINKWLRNRRTRIKTRMDNNIRIAKLKLIRIARDVNQIKEVLLPL